MNSTTLSLLDQENSLFHLVLKAASLLLFLAVGVYGNGRIIYTVLVADVLRPVLNLFVASLSIADLATCIVIMPISFVALVSGDWVFGRVFCTIHGMLLVYFAHVAGLSTWAIVYERYQAIYRKRFPSLSNWQVTVILCTVWILPIVFVGPMARQDLSYSRSAGICLDTYQNDKTWNTIFLVKAIIATSLGLLFVLFSFWKIISLVLPIRRRVSHELMSNEEKLTVAAHARSAWTTIIFVLIYTILVLPLHVVRIVEIQRENAGTSRVADDVTCAFLWLYWLQCAIKPVIYVTRSERYTSRLCRCLPETDNHVEATRFFRRRNRASVYKAREGNSENNLSDISGRIPALSPGEFINLRTVPTEPLTGQPALQSLGQKIQDERVSTDNVEDHSVVIIEGLIMTSCIMETNEETNCSQDERHDDGNAVLADVCYDAVELENIERMFDEALQDQQREWETEV